LQIGSPDDRTSSIAADGIPPYSGLGRGGIVHGILFITVTYKVTIKVNLKGLRDIRAQNDAFIIGAQEIPA
jgi:hypothetical protein